MRYLPLLAIALYVAIGFVPPKQITVTQVKASMMDFLEHLDTAKRVLKPVWKTAVETEPNGDVRRLFHTIELARVQNDVHACNDLEPIPLLKDSPSLGDWIAYCLARVRSDKDRCPQISDTIHPNVKQLCIEEFGS